MSYIPARCVKLAEHLCQARCFSICVLRECFIFAANISEIFTVLHGIVPPKCLVFCSVLQLEKVEHHGPRGT